MREAIDLGSGLFVLPLDLVLCCYQPVVGDLYLELVGNGG